MRVILEGRGLSAFGRYARGSAYAPQAHTASFRPRRATGACVDGCIMWDRDASSTSEGIKYWKRVGIRHRYSFRRDHKRDYIHHSVRDSFGDLQYTS